MFEAENRKVIDAHLSKISKIANDPLDFKI